MGRFVWDAEYHRDVDLLFCHIGTGTKLKIYVKAELMGTDGFVSVLMLFSPQPVQCRIPHRSHGPPCRSRLLWSQNRRRSCHRRRPPSSRSLRPGRSCGHTDPATAGQSHPSCQRRMCRDRPVPGFVAFLDLLPGKIPHHLRG